MASRARIGVSSAVAAGQLKLPHARREPRLICGQDCFGGGLDELGYVAGVGDHRHVARWDLGGGGTHALGELALSVGGIASSFSATRYQDGCDSGRPDCW